MKTVVECKEGGIVTVECGCEGAKTEQTSPEPRRGRRPRRHISDELVLKWVNSWRENNTPFLHMAEEDDFDPPVVGFNVYKYCAIASQKEIADLKDQLSRARLNASHWIDMYGKLEAECGKRSDLIEAMKARIIELETKNIELEDAVHPLSRKFLGEQHAY
jgi:hypothetical protein